MTPERCTRAMEPLHQRACYTLSEAWNGGAGAEAPKIPIFQPLKPEATELGTRVAFRSRGKQQPRVGADRPCGA